MNESYTQAMARQMAGSTQAPPPPPESVSAHLNNALNNLSTLNERLEALHARFYGPQPKGESQGKIGPLSMLDTARTLDVGIGGALDRLSSIEAQL